MDVRQNPAVGEIYKYCRKYGMNPNELSLFMKVNSIRVYEILKGKRKVTPDTDIRLAKVFGLENGHFVNLQIKWELENKAMELESVVDKLKFAGDIK